MSVQALRKSKGGIILPPSPNADFADKLRGKLSQAEIDSIEIFPTDVLVAVFVRRMHSANILAATGSQNEDRWQGKVGVVLKIGSEAFKDSGTVKFHGFLAKAGDFVMFRNNDGWDFNIRAAASPEMIPCKQITDSDIKGRVSQPDLIY